MLNAFMIHLNIMLSYNMLHIPFLFSEKKNFKQFSSLLISKVSVRVTLFLG
jgi:hypothetical protein